MTRLGARAAPALTAVVEPQRAMHSGDGADLGARGDASILL
jgi:hypothetical protein